eukprot:jgi/Bigna1/144368/aug1.87_g19076
MQQRNKKKLSPKIGSGYDTYAAKKIFEETQKEKACLMSRFKPKHATNPLKEATPRGRSTAQNSLRIRNGKQLTAKIGAGFSAEASHESYVMAKKEQMKILKVRRPKHPTNPLSEENLSKQSAESPKNSLRMRTNKPFPAKINSTYSKEESLKCFQEMRKPKLAVWEMGEWGGASSDNANMKNSLRMRNGKTLSKKIGNSSYDGQRSYKSYQESKKGYHMMIARRNPAKRRNPLEDAAPKAPNPKVPQKKQLSAKINSTYSKEESLKCFQEMRKEKAKILARVKPVNPRNPLTG